MVYVVLNDVLCLTTLNFRDEGDVVFKAPVLAPGRLSGASGSLTEKRLHRSMSPDSIGPLFFRLEGKTQSCAVLDWHIDRQLGWFHGSIVVIPLISTPGPSGSSPARLLPFQCGGR